MRHRIDHQIECNLSIEHNELVLKYTIVNSLETSILLFDSLICPFSKDHLPIAMPDFSTFVMDECLYLLGTPHKLPTSIQVFMPYPISFRELKSGKSSTQVWRKKLPILERNIYFDNRLAKWEPIIVQSVILRIGWIEKSAAPEAVVSSNRNCILSVVPHEINVFEVVSPAPEGLLCASRADIFDRFGLP